MSAVFYLALRSLRRRKVRNILTGLTVTLSAAFVTAFVATRAHLHDLAVKQEKAALVMVMPALMGSTIDVQKLAALEKLPEVLALSASFVLPTAMPDGRSRFAIAAVTGDPFAVTHDHDYFALDEQARDAWRKSRGAAVAGQTVAAEMGWKVGDGVTVPTPAGDLKLDIVGIASAGQGGREVVAHFDYVDSLMGAQNQAHIAVVKARAGTSLTKLSSSVEQTLEDGSQPVQAMPERVFAEMLEVESKAILGMLSFMGLVFAALTVLVTANTVRLSVSERVQEMATLRTLGFGPGAVAGVTLLEAALICGLGGVLGVLVLYAAGRSGLELGTFALANVDVSGAHGVPGVLFGLVVALLAGLPAALRGARRPIIDDLRAI